MWISWTLKLTNERRTIPRASNQSPPLLSLSLPFCLVGSYPNNISCSIQYLWPFLFTEPHTRTHAGWYTYCPAFVSSAVCLCAHVHTFKHLFVSLLISHINSRPLFYKRTKRIKYPLFHRHPFRCTPFLFRLMWQVSSDCLEQIIYTPFSTL